MKSQQKYEIMGIFIDLQKSLPKASILYLLTLTFY